MIFIKLSLCLGLSLFIYSMLSPIQNPHANAAATTNPEIVQISLGIVEVLALAKDGSVWTWSSDKMEPVQNPYLHNIVEISNGGSHYLALDQNGQVWSWGDNFYGQLGDGFYTKYDYSSGKAVKVEDHSREIPYKVEGLPFIAHIKAGLRESIALSKDGTVWAWGYNLTNFVYGPYNPQAGHNDLAFEERRLKPYPVEGLNGTVSLFEEHGYPRPFETRFAVKSDGSVWGWGTNPYRLFGPEIREPVDCNGCWQQAWSPVKLAQPVSVHSIQYFDSTTVAYLQDGSVVEWGDEFLDTTPFDPVEYHNPKVIDHPVPVKTPELQGFRKLAKTEVSTSPSFFGLKTDGTLWARGDNSWSESGIPGLLSSDRWVRVKGLPKVKDFEYFINVYAVGEDGSVWYMGPYTIGKKTVTIVKPLRLPFLGKPDRASIVINGFPSPMTNVTLRKDGEVTAPLSGLSLLNKITIQYGANNESTVIKYGKKTVKLTPNSSIAYVNGKKVSIPVKAKIAGKEWIVPMSWLAKSLGGTAKWNEQQQSLHMKL